MSSIFALVVLRRVDIAMMSALFSLVALMNFSGGQSESMTCNGAKMYPPPGAYY